MTSEGQSAKMATNSDQIIAPLLRTDRVLWWKCADCGDILHATQYSVNDLSSGMYCCSHCDAAYYVLWQQEEVRKQ